MFNLLQSLSVAGQELEALDDTAAQLAIVQRVVVRDDHLAEARSIASPDLWTHLQAQKIVLADVARALARVIALSPQPQAMRAAALYTTLLRSPGCPTLSLFDRVVCGALLKLLREAALQQQPRKASKKKENQETDNAFFGDDMMDIDGNNNEQPCSQSAAPPPSDLLARCIHDFAAVLSNLALGDQQDTARLVAETFADVAAVPSLPPPARDAAYAILTALLTPTHGSSRELSAMVFKLLTPHVLGVLSSSSGGKVTAKAASGVRTSALAFVEAALKERAACEDAAAALMRNAALRAPDRADGRAAAAEVAVALCSALGADHRAAYIAFVARLSRTNKPAQRLAALDVAAALLQATPASSNNDDESPYKPPSQGAAAVPTTGRLLPSAVAALRRGGAAATVDMRGSLVFTPGSAGGRALAGLTPVGQLQQQAAVPAPWGAVCLAIIVQRVADKTPAVRGRALHHVAALCSSAPTATAAAEREFVAALAAAATFNLKVAVSGTPAKGRMTPGGESVAPGTGTTVRSLLSTENTPHNAGRMSLGSNVAASPILARAVWFAAPTALLVAGGAAVDLSSLLRTLRQRCRDDKGVVRKSAVQALEAALMVEQAQGGLPLSSSSCPAAETAAQPNCRKRIISKKDLEAIEVAAGDALVSVRKAALAAAASLAEALPADAGVAGVWVAAVLPLIRDPESAVQEAVLDQTQGLLLGRAVAVKKNGAEVPPGLLPLLAAVSQGGAAARGALARVCSQLRSKGQLAGKKVCTGLETLLSGPQEGGNLSGEEAAGAWLLYAEVAVQAPTAPSWVFLQAQWAKLESHGGGAAAQQRQQHATSLLKVVATAAAQFPAEQAAALCAQLRAGLEGLALPPAAAAAHVAALCQLTRAHSGCTGESGVKSWSEALLSSCEDALAAAIDALRVQDPSAAAELSGIPSSPAGSSGSSPASKAAPALFLAGEVALLHAAAPSARLVTLVQALTSATLVAEGGAAATVPAAAQAIAWVTLGKMCLVNEPLAKKCVPLFVQELGRASSPAVRNNIMVALADLVVQYTALVDAHIPRLAACLRDPNELVRTQALGLLANLLQKDYVKWRGPLFLRFVLALVDESPRVAALAEYLLGDALESKLPNLAYNHFVEALFVLNDCAVGLAGGAAAAGAVADLPGATAAEREAFSLKGSDPAVRAKRDAVYQALLRKMAPEHKFATAARLCQEVLGGAADGSLPLSECGEVVGDALRVLGSKAIKVAATKAKDADADDAPGAAAAAKGRLVSQMMKKHLVEGVVPVVIELKRSMEAERHPLLGDLMAAAAAMLKDHKAEIEDILAADRQLAKEILYDLRQAEVAEAARAAEAAAAAAEQRDGVVAVPVSAAVEASKTPGVVLSGVSAANAAATATPGAPLSSGGGRLYRPSPRPPGTSSRTPIAAEVLIGAAAGLEASLDPLSRPAAAAAMPGGGVSSPAVSAVAATAATPGGLRSAVQVATGRRTVRGPSRLANASTATVGKQQVPATVPGSGYGGALLLSPGGGGGALRAGMAPSPAAPRVRRTSRFAPSAAQAAAAAAVDCRQEEAESDHVDLPFGVPDANGAAVAAAQWEMAPGVAPAEAAERCGGGDGSAAMEEGGELEEEVGGRGRRRATRAAAGSKNDGLAGTRRKRSSE